MEHAIGTKITLEVVESNKDGMHPCTGCFFDYENTCMLPGENICRKNSRSDRKNIIYKEIKED